MTNVQSVDRARILSGGAELSPAKPKPPNPKALTEVRAGDDAVLVKLSKVKGDPGDALSEGYSKGGPNVKGVFGAKPRPIGGGDTPNPAKPELISPIVDEKPEIKNAADKAQLVKKDTPPSPGEDDDLAKRLDLTGDGKLDIFDVLNMLESFANQDSSADFDGNGKLSIDDVKSYLDKFQKARGE